MARFIQVAALLAALCAVNVADVLTAETGAAGAPRVAAEGDAAKEAPAAAAAGDTDADHVRDKRRLPDPGFIIPATPMGFSKNGQPAQQEARSERQPSPAPPAPPAPTPAERKVSSPSMMASASSAAAYSTRGSPAYTDSVAAPSRHKKAPAKPALGSREAPVGREEHVRALTSFLSQTRKLGVPDEQALKLLDKELAKAKRQGPAYRPVYHATPLKPYGALINFNQMPYEKHQLKGMKPIKEQQNDIPPPNKPILVESDGQVLKASPAPIPGRHTQALATPNGPLPVSVPRPLQLLQTSHKLSPAAFKHSSPQILSGPLSSGTPQHVYQTISLPAASYKQEETYQSLDHSQYLQGTPIEQTMDSETPVSLESMHSYPVPEQHVISAPLPQEHLVSAVAAPQVTVEEVRQARPVYVYQQEELKLPQPQAEVHVELPTPVVTKEELHEQQSQGGLYHDQKEQPEEYASQYRFGYRVRDQHAGNDFGHAETRDGKMTKGEYFVTLPDGRLQSVKYWADQGGYHAQISYTNHASHPAPAPAPAQRH